MDLIIYTSDFFVGYTYPKSKMFCIPLYMRIHDGDEQIRKWKGEGETEIEDSHVVRIIKDAC